MLTLLSASVIHAASFPTELRFRTLKGPHLSVHYPRGLEVPARRALSLGEELLARHQARYGGRIRRVQVVLADVDDDPNGFASPAALPTGPPARWSRPAGPTSSATTRLAAPGAGARAGARGPPRPGARMVRRGARRARPRAVPLPQRRDAHLDDRGAGHLRGDRSHRLRARRDPDARMVLRMEALDARAAPRGRARAGPGPLAGRPAPATSSASRSCADRRALRPGDAARPGARALRAT